MGSCHRWVLGQSIAGMAICLFGSWCLAFCALRQLIILIKVTMTIDINDNKLSSSNAGPGGSVTRVTGASGKMGVE